MSVPTGLPGPRAAVRGDEVEHNAQNNLRHAGDANANRIELTGDVGDRGVLLEDGYLTGYLPLLLPGSDAPRRAKLPARAGQGEEQDTQEDGVGDGGKDAESPMSVSSGSTASSASFCAGGNACRSSEGLDACVEGSAEAGAVATSRGRERERRKGGLTESKSETNVFNPSLSTVPLSGSLASALDGSGVSPPPQSNSNISCYSSSHRRGPPNLDEQREARRDEGGRRDDGLSPSDARLGVRRKGGFEERPVSPRRQQLVRPLCQAESGKGWSFVEPAATAAPREPERRASSPPDPRGHGAHRRFQRSALRKPSDVSHLYGVPMAPHRRHPGGETSVEAQPSTAVPPPSPSNLHNVENRAQTQLTYRRNCSSPNRSAIRSRSATPPGSPLGTSPGSPRRQTSVFPVSRSAPGPRHPHPQQPGGAVEASSQGHSSGGPRAPVKTNASTTGIPKAPLNNQRSPPPNRYPSSIPREAPLSPKSNLKPKGVRPKIITYVRKSPQARPQVVDGPYHVASVPSRLSAFSQASCVDSLKDAPKDPPRPGVPARGAAVFSASNLLYERYRQDVQATMFPSGVLRGGPRPSGHTLPSAHSPAAGHTHLHSHTAPPKLGGSRRDNFYGSQSDKYPPSEMAAQTGGTGSLMRSGRGLRLGLGAVTRTATVSAKGRVPGQVQRSSLGFSQPVQAISRAANQKGLENAEDQHASSTPPALAPGPAPTPALPLPLPLASRPLQPRGAQTGLRPPVFRSFGFVRSSNVSSSSSQIAPCRTGQRLSDSEERGGSSRPPAVPLRGAVDLSLQPPSTPVLHRRCLPPPPQSSPAAGRKEFQWSSEISRSLPSSPKRLAVVPPKPQSPVRALQRPSAAVRGSVPPAPPRQGALFRPPPDQQETLQREKEEAQRRERENETEESAKKEQRDEVQRLQRRYEQQEQELAALREELRKTTLGLDAFIVTTQHYCLKKDGIEEKERALSLEVQTIKQELAGNWARLQRLQGEKTALEEAFERQLREVQLQQEQELASVEEGLRRCHSAEADALREEQRSLVEELRTQQQEQLEEVTLNHQADLQELRDMHNVVMATLHEEHGHTMRDLRKAHERQKMVLEEDFEKLRLFLQDQVDTLTFQNHSLRDKAQRFEQALRQSTDDQIVEALAPYQHIEDDLKSLKEVVEMKNQQIHQQEKKISDLEKVAQKNVFLEERLQVLQQQNEDLKARIERNLSLSRQLSEDNANLQMSAEQEYAERERLSRNNEELLWRLQTSPHASPCPSPHHRSFSASPLPSSPFHSSTSPLPSSPFHSSTSPLPSSPFHSSSSPLPSPPFHSSSPRAGCDSPSHCHGCPQSGRPAHSFSPSRRAAANLNLSPGPATPTHRATTNYNYSPGPATPTHRATTNHCTPVAALQR